MSAGFESGGENPRRSNAASRRALDGPIWAMAWPAMLSYMLMNIVDIVDVLLVGRLGRESIAAYGYAAQLQHLVQMAIQSVGIGCVALMSRAVGARDAPRARRMLAGSMFVAVCIAVLATGVVWTVPDMLLRLLRADERVIGIAGPYLQLSVTATLLASMAFSLESGLRAYRLTRIPMLIAVVVTLVKALLSYALIFGHFSLPRLGLLGAGYATIGAYAVGLYLYFRAARYAERQGHALTFGLPELGTLRASVRAVLAVSLPAIGERLIMSLALLTYFAILSDYGTAAVAAYAIGVRLLSFSWVPGLGFATAAATFVGQSLGQADAAGARNAGNRAVRLAVAVMMLCGLVCVCAREPLARMFTDDDEVVVRLLPFMLMLGLAQPFMGAHFTLGGALRGAGDTVTPLIAAGIGNWVFRVPLAFLYAQLGLSLAWVWSALIVDHVARMLYSGSVYWRGRWADRLGAAVSSGTP